MIYSAGLRISEMVNMKISNIDRDRNIIKIIDAKGHKDRIVGLSQKLILEMDIYLKQYHPAVYLVEGINGERYSARSIQNILKKALKLAKISKHGTVHTLRHSYATHLLESGIDIKIIQSLLGHKSIKTTERYTHVSNKVIGSIKSPLDEL